MTSKEVSKLFRQVADILNCYGDIPISEALNKIYHLSISEKTKIHDDKEVQEVNIEIDQNLIRKMSLMDSDELKMFLESNEVFQFKKTLMQLAEVLNLSVTTRSNRETLILTILKHFERQRLDSIIRNERI